MNFIAINELVNKNTPVITVPVYPFCSKTNPIWMRIYAVPVGIDHGHIGNGSLIYKCVDRDELVQFFSDNCTFEGLHGAQLDDIDAIDGREFTFADDGTYGICDFRVPAKIRNHNVYIKEFGVIQWESRVYSCWFDDCDEPEVYQWNPETDMVRKKNGNNWTEWSCDYEIDPEDYSVIFFEPDDDLPF